VRFSLLSELDNDNRRPGLEETAAMSVECSKARAAMYNGNTRAVSRASATRKQEVRKVLKLPEAIVGQARWKLSIDSSTSTVVLVPIRTEGSECCQAMHAFCR
jgi:hypothetical protein